MFLSKLLTCRLCSGEDELGRAAASDLSIARVDVDAVNGEGLQTEDLQLALRHRLLHELELSVRRIGFGGAAVAGNLERRGRAAVAVQLVAPGLRGVGDAEQISAAAIRWPEK